MIMRRVAGFSLVEVVIAIGIVAFALTAILGLFAAITRSAIESNELQRTRSVAGISASIIEDADYDSVVNQMLVDTDATASVANMIFVSVDLRNFGRGENVSKDKRFYAVTIERNAAISPIGETVTYAAITFRIEWPWSESNGQEIGANVRRLNYVLLRP